MSEVKKAVRQFKRLLGKKPLSFEAVADIISTKGYSTSFFDTEQEDELLNKYKLTEYAKTVKAFNFKKNDYRITFIDSKEHPTDKLYLILHEAGHIFLMHTTSNKLVTNNRLLDIEADAFAYMVLSSNKRY